MRYICDFFLITALCSCVASHASAQNENLISGNFDNISFGRFVDTIESQTHYHFYYTPSQLDSFPVTIHVKNETLKNVLKKIFGETEFQYAVDHSNNVFVVRKYIIETDLVDGFFDQKKNLNDTLQTEGPDLTENPEGKQNQKLRSSLENKLFEIGIKSNKPVQGSATIAGYVRDNKTGEAISGAALYIDNPPIGVVTDQFGYYSFNLPRGRHTIKVTSIGMRETKRQVMLYSDGRLNIELQEYIPTLKTVIVSSEKLSNIKGLQMGVERLTIKVIKQIPVVFGEADVLRAVLTLPGVTSVGEGSTGFNVRGGSANQNLILFNDATIYNPSHLFGFFSAFNPDVVKDVELYKSSIPEKYGGRLSSVLDITAREGNKKKFSGSGGIGPLTAKLVLEGPIDSGKTSFIIGGRTSYSDWLLKQIPDKEYKNSSASFYDANLGISHEMNRKNSLFITGYLSNDRFSLNGDTSYQYSNKNANIKWKHIFNTKFYGTLTAGFDRYQYLVESNYNPVNAYQQGFDVNQTFLKADFNYVLSANHTLDFGVSSLFYKLHPGSFLPIGGQSLVVPDILQSQQALESAAYLGDKFSIGSKLSVEAGIRYSFFDYLGTHDVYNYIPGLPLQEITITDTVSFKSGKTIKTYQSPEYRVSARYLLSDNSSVKVSYNTLIQYVHMLSNTISISPTDTWTLSDPHIKPQTGDQVSLGYYRNFKSNTIETSVEVYYKRMYNYLDYKSGAALTMNHHIETDVITTRGKAYGVELMIKKQTGKLNGWISYAYSRTLLQQDDPNAGQTINGGNFYPADFDKPHNVNFIANYKFTHRFSVSLNITYSTGRPITLPIALYDLAGSQRVFYSERNQYRVPDYFRTDLSMNIEGNHKIKKIKHSSWTIGVYNLTGRKNPYSIYFLEQNGNVYGYKLSIFGTIIPAITYNFRF